MNHYAKAVIDKITKEIFHVAVSDAPFIINPFNDIEDSQEIIDYEFNSEDDSFIRGREFLTGIDHQNESPKIENDRRFVGLKKVVK